MVELGIGGSLSYFAQRARPSILVGIEYSATRVVHLDRFIESRRLGDVVRPYYGVDQADGDRLREIIVTELRGEPIDLVVDDASHRYDGTLASFEALYPMVCPGGLCIIEDGQGGTRSPMRSIAGSLRPLRRRHCDWRHGSPTASSREPVSNHQCPSSPSSSCWRKRRRTG
jgi:hypothetical protein